MRVFSKASSTQARLKAGMFGFEGTGKTFTASLIMIGLHRYLDSKLPMAFFDTETGSDYVKPLFDQAGIDLVTVKAHDLKTLNMAMKEAEGECFGLIIDSLTHVYKEVCSAYVKQKRDGTNFIRMQDWQPIKEAWRNYFSNPYVNSNIHMIWCSRAKNIFEDVLDELATSQSGREQFKSVQVGTGARSESESAYEPSVLIEMQKVLLREGGKYARQAIYIKERFNILDGMTFDYPKVTTEQALKENKPFMDLLPHIQHLNLRGQHVGFKEGDSTALFDDQYDQGLAQVRRRRTVALEKIENALVAVYPAAQGKDKQAKLKVLELAFGTTSWTEIQTFGVEKQEAGANLIAFLKTRMEIDGPQYEAPGISAYIAEYSEMRAQKPEQDDSADKAAA